MRAISAMQDSRVIVPPMGQDIPQRVVSEPVSVPWVAIRKTVSATAYRHDLRIRLACEKRRLARIGFIRLLDGRAVLNSNQEQLLQAHDRRHKCNLAAVPVANCTSVHSNEKLTNSENSAGFARSEGSVII